MIKFNISISKPQIVYSALVALSLSSCATASNLKDGAVYQKELEFSINGTKAKGTFVAPKATSYKMNFAFPDSAAVVKLTTCHREETFRNIKSLNYEYRPQRFLEDAGSCLMEVASFNLAGANAWALIDFQGEEAMVGNQGCNGQTWLAKGVSLCQSRSGLIQTITFQKPVKAAGPERCPKMTSTDQLNFYYEMAKDKCVYLFNDGPNLHRLTTVGYDEVLLK